MNKAQAIRCGVEVIPIVTNCLSYEFGTVLVTNYVSGNFPFVGTSVCRTAEGFAQLGGLNAEQCKEALCTSEFLSHGKRWYLSWEGTDLYGVSEEDVSRLSIENFDSLF